MLTVFDSNGNKIAQNDNYYGSDSALQLDLQPGTYYVGVTSVGNSSYNPLVPGSGSGGTSQGAYDLRLDFQPDAVAGLVSAAPSALVGAAPSASTTPVSFDGDADGQPGGTYNYWFQVQTAANTVYVDKMNGATGGYTGTGTLGTITNPYSNIATAPTSTTSGDVVRIIGNSKAVGNDSFAYNIGFNLLNQPLSDGSTLAIPKGVTVMVDNGGIGSNAVFKLSKANITAGSISQGINLSGGSLQILGTPSSGQAFLVNAVQAAPTGIQSGDTVTVTNSSNVTHTFQFLTSGNSASAGDMAVNFTLGSTPTQLAALLAAAINADHTLAVSATSTAGLVKLTGAANLSSATTGVTVDGGLNDVIFTSYNDQSVAPVASPLVAAPSPGDWGGIVFNSDADHEANGIFLDSVDHATIKYGGGQVVVNSTEQVFDAIHLIDSRPSIQFNTILDSADAAMSGDPTASLTPCSKPRPIFRPIRTTIPTCRTAPATRPITAAPARPFTATACREIRSTACSSASVRKRVPVSTSSRCRPRSPTPTSPMC